jgi:uncharacterized repeat protein (TIGR03803 family)
MSKLTWVTKACGVFLLWAAAAVTLPAQTFTSLYSFDGTDGAFPLAGLVQGTNGQLYGTANTGGANGDGAVFSLTPSSGAFSVLHSFDGTDGESPSAELVLGANGIFYGSTYDGGAYGVGTVFSMTASGALTTLHSFDGTDGANPFAGLVQAANGKFYGTTAFGGASSDTCPIGCGTVFSITENGTLTTLHSFEGMDGYNPLAVLFQDADGIFYGTTSLGGSSDACPVGCGTVFSITGSGALTMLHSFDYTDGVQPVGGLVRGANGQFYGTTSGGGANDYGTIFSITTSGTLMALYNFCSQTNCTDGEDPNAGLVLGTNSGGQFYGTTSGGGANNLGTIFSITPGGALMTLHSFDGTDGEDPGGGLFQGTNAEFYGTTSYGGSSDACTIGCGTIFSMNEDFGQFVETNPTSGKVGVAVKILGTFLTGATSVTFHGTPATFTVISKSEITTTVPAGATTGTVKVATPRSGTLSSNVPFRVN